MKKILVSILVATMIGASLVGCGGDKNKGNDSNGSKVEDQQGKEVATKDIVTAVEEYIPMPQERSEQEVKDVYEINLDNVEEYSVIECGRSPGLGLAMVLKAKEGKVDEVKEEVQKYLDREKENRFYPDEKDAYGKAEVKVNGNIVSLLVFSDDVNDEAMSKFDEIIK